MPLRKVGLSKGEKAIITEYSQQLCMQDQYVLMMNIYDNNNSRKHKSTGKGLYWIQHPAEAHLKAQISL